MDPNKPEPHTPTDDLRREAIALVERWSGRWLGHGGIKADRKRLDNALARTFIEHGFFYRAGSQSRASLAR